MNETFSVADITTLLGAITAVLVLWWRVETRISAGAVKAQAKADQVEKDLADYKLTVATHYAQDKDIRDVEIRVLANIANVAQELSRLRESIDNLLRSLATQRGET